MKENEALLLRFKYYSFFDLNPKVQSYLLYLHLAGKGFGQRMPLSLMCFCVGKSSTALKIGLAGIKPDFACSHVPVCSCLGVARDALGVA